MTRVPRKLYAFRMLMIKLTVITFAWIADNTEGKRIAPLQNRFDPRCLIEPFGKFSLTQLRLRITHHQADVCLPHRVNI
jgi:hypothetical protein